MCLPSMLFTAAALLDLGTVTHLSHLCLLDVLPHALCDAAARNCQRLHSQILLRARTQ